MKFLGSLLLFLVALGLLLAFYKLGPGSRSIAFAILVAGAVYLFFFR